jgi:hypothetical protein
MINLLSDLLPQLSPRLRNCPANIQLAALRQGWRDFATRSGAWRDTIKLAYVPGQLTYALMPQWDAEILAVVTDEGRCCGVRTRTAYDQTMNWAGTVLSGNMYDVLLYADPLGAMNQNILPAQPSSAASSNGIASLILRDVSVVLAGVVEICVDVILVPTLNPSDDSLPISLANYAGGGIVSGALAWLAGQTGKPWMDAGMFKLESEKFSDECTRAFMDTVRGGRNTPIVQHPSEVF